MPCFTRCWRVECDRSTASSLPLGVLSANLSSWLGIRIVRSHRDASPPSGRLGNWARVHLHHAQAATSRHQGGREKFDPGTPTRRMAREKEDPPPIHLLTSPKACLNAPEPAGNGENGADDPNIVDSPEEPVPQHLPPQQGRAGMPQQVQNMHPGYMPQDINQQQLAYNNYMASQTRGGYPMPPQAGIPQQHSHQS
jgi:hypothetical protein